MLKKLTRWRNPDIGEAVFFRLPFVPDVELYATVAGTVVHPAGSSRELLTLQAHHSLIYTGVAFRSWWAEQRPWVLVR